jgi:hypothetical protein
MTTPHERKDYSMNTKGEYENRSLVKRSKHGIRGALALLLLPPVVAWAGGVVTNCTEAALRTAMAGGGAVTFDCDGTITLANTITNASDTTLDGSGHQITISGNSACRVIFLNTNVNSTLLNLTIAEGRSDTGAGIYNAGGYLTVHNCVFIGNTAIGQAGVDGSPGRNGRGGALFNAGLAIITNSTFSTNTAVGGAGGSGTNATQYPGTGGSGGAGGLGYGGAIYNSCELTLADCTLNGNTVSGGAGGTGGSGANWNSFPGGNGGVGGSSYGGALFNNGVARSVNTTLADNASTGGSGGAGGFGGGSSTSYGGNGGNGNAGGSGLGGGIYDLTGHCSITNCTLAFNSVVAGDGGAGGHGAYGNYGNGSPGLPGAAGSASGGGINASGGMFLINVLLASNAPSNGSGSIIDGGHNLSSDNSCGFTNVGSLNNSNAPLGPLMDNGGPTLTMALLPGNPAIDAGDDAAAPPTDQRGALRPVGLASDIGAYECGPPAITMPPPSQSVAMGSTVDFQALAAGSPPLNYQWFFNGTNAIAGATNSVLHLVNVQPSQSGTYAVMVTNAFGAVTSSPAMLDVVFRTVTRCAEAVLRLAIAEGGPVTFACDGTITLSDTIVIGTDTVLDGSGHQVTISGGDAVRVFSVRTNVSFEVINLTIAHGFGRMGGGILNLGTLAAEHCTFYANSAVGDVGANGGVGGEGDGGAVCNLGILDARDSTFLSNSVSGGQGGKGSDGIFIMYPYPGGPGGLGGAGNGSGLFNAGVATVAKSTFTGNIAMGGAGGSGGAGSRAIYDLGAPMRGADGGNGGQGGSAGGAVSSTSNSCLLTNCTLAFNSGIKGAGGPGGSGGMGAGGGAAGSPGRTGPDGEAVGGLCSIGWIIVMNTALTGNAPGGNCSGRFTDAGQNFSSDSSCPFTNSSPVIVTLPESQTVELGGDVELTVEASSPLPPSCQWFFNDTVPVPGATGLSLHLPAAQFAQAGAYSLVLTTLAGATTSAPVMLNVIAPVEHRPAAGVLVMGGAGSLLSVDYADSLSATPNWFPLDTVTLASTPQYCFDVSQPLPPQRFYRAWQAGTPGILPSLSLLGIAPAITLTGSIGHSVRLDYINQFGPTDAWVTLATVALTNTSQLYFDTSARGQPDRLYRVVPLP